MDTPNLKNTDATICQDEKDCSFQTKEMMRYQCLVQLLNEQGAELEIIQQKFQLPLSNCYLCWTIFST